ncbi:MAG: glycoside hydrolase family 97 protein [Cyclobacteriaceae bacterium]
MKSDTDAQMISFFKNLQLLALFLVFVSSCSQQRMTQEKISSPDGFIESLISIQDGKIFYQISYKGKPVINPSRLGFLFKRMEGYDSGFIISEIKRSTMNETWEQVWGQNKSVQNHYTESIISFGDNEGNAKMNLIFRVFNDGVGFRYHLPEQDGIDSVRIVDELTAFNFKEDLSAWYTPANFESYEMLYQNVPLSQVASANTPVTFEKDGLVVSIHEANLTNYAGMTLRKDEEDKFSFQCDLVPWPDGDKVKATLPFVTPWRTIQIAKSAKHLLTSNLILNLNEPNQIEDLTWVRPIKYIGVWWGMHIGTHTWTMGERHGATTETMIKYIDFASKHEIEAVLAEGWSTGWEHWGRPKAFDFVTPYEDFDLQKVVDYASQKGIAFVGHHETGGDAEYYEEQIEEAFQLYEALGVNHVKTGYAGAIRPAGQYHHGQYMVNHYRKVVEEASKYNINIDVHEPIKPTGIRRTYPNMMTREGARGMEWNGWSEGNPPSHHVILPFTRNLAGPIDYTPGIFDLLYQNAGRRVKWNGQDKGNSRTNTTLAKQLALFVIFHSPMQMASDLIENYEGEKAFRFIENVPVDWEKTTIINGEIGSYVTIARKDIGSEDWYLGSITNESERAFNISLDFLDENKKYKAQVYADASDTHWKTNPYPYDVQEVEVDASHFLDIRLAGGGGQAIRFEALNNSGR